MADKSPSEEIDGIIAQHDGWKGEILTRVRAVILAVDPEIIEATKWKTASRPEGIPVWMRKGNVCMAEVWKDNVKLLFPKGAMLRDEHNLFNARLQSSTDRAIEYREGDTVDDAKLKALVAEAVEYDQTNNR